MNSVVIPSPPCGEQGSMGRRSQTDEGERRTATLTVQLTPTERAELGERADAAGVRLSDFARSALLGHRLTVKDPLKERAIQELAAIGNNLNQLARRANITEEIDAEDLGRALRLWREVVGRLFE